MRLCRFNENRLGVVDGDLVRDVTTALEVLPSFRYPLPNHDLMIAGLEAVRHRITTLLPGTASVPLASVKLLSPVANPGKIIAAPVNYQKHLDEVRVDAALHANNPGHTITIQSAGLFLKATSSLTGQDTGIGVCRPDRRTDHEVELVVVIGRRGRNIPRDEALSYVAGYSVGLDVTIRGSEDRSFRKSPDTYSVLGPWLVTPDEIPDPGALDLELSVNGERRQKSNTRYLILGVPELIELASSFYTLYPGDVIFTGTPEGVSPIQPGDEVIASIERVGRLRVHVQAAETMHAADTDSVAHRS